MLRISPATVVAAAFALSIAAQNVPSPPVSSSSPDAPYVATMTYDVASVRENKNADLNVGITMSGRFVPHTTMFRAINWSIDNLIGYAYGVDQYQIAGSPKWPWPTVFVIEAKGDSEADAKMAALTQEQQL